MLTFSNAKLRCFAKQGISALGLAAVIMTAASPSEARVKRHFLHSARHIGGSPHGSLAATFAGEANPNRYSIARVCRSIENRTRSARWGNTGSMQAVVSAPHQYAPNWANAARNPIYQQAASIALSQGCSAIDAAGAASVGSADSFHSGCGRENCFYSAGSRTRVALRRAPGYARQRVAVRAAPAYGQSMTRRQVRVATYTQPAAPATNQFDPFGILSPNE